MMSFRRLALLLSGLTFASIGLVALFMPVTVARVYGFALLGVEGLDEFRAVYTGFWWSLAVAMITAARRKDVPLLGDVCGLMLLLQALGRAASFALDGRPSWPFVCAFVAELSGALAILAPRVMPIEARA